MIFSRRFRPVKRCVFTILLMFLLLIPLLAEQRPRISAVLDSAVVDLRPDRGLRLRNNNSPGRASSVADLEVGTIFLTVGDKARRVVDIYDYNGRTVVETVEPRLEEVFLVLHIPDFEISASRQAGAQYYLGEGVSFISPSEARNMEPVAGDFLPGEPERSLTWLETDPETETMSYESLNINVPLWTKSVSSADANSLDDMEEDAREKDAAKTQDSNGITTETGGTPETDWGVSGEVRLLGTLRFTDPVFTGGLKKPSMTVTWVKDWWCIYHPEFHFHDGYAKAEVRSAQQFDFRLTGTVSLEAERKIPIYGIVLKYSGIELALGVYAKISLDGKISLSVEVSEFTKFTVGASCDLWWPFIPHKFDGHQSSYMNLAYRPTVAASAELRAGLYLGGSFEISGITVVEAEAGGGGYISAEGFMEPLGIMGYDTDSGGYGNFNDWILDLTAEAGAYAEAGVEIISYDISLFDRTWPFWQWHKSWEW